MQGVVYPIVAPKKAPDIAESTVMIARIMTFQMFLLGRFCTSSTMVCCIDKWVCVKVLVVLGFVILGCLFLIRSFRNVANDGHVGIVQRHFVAHL